ncbi:uncharacterized protein [Solanum tuberosum]|uniref:uncharacterized protein isoform X2 n=1 Tax=Solanum tuberosum TaxID=4113 RepID=UPI00073A3DF9|nr:PREDICTED: uncharacterized protein LOC107063227 isoform X2 [Solanum tuberosum]
MSLIYPLIKRKIKASAIFSECNFNFQCRRCRGSSIFFYLQVTLSREKNQLLPPQRSSSHVLDVSKYSFQRGYLMRRGLEEESKARYKFMQAFVEKKNTSCILF